MIKRLKKVKIMTLLGPSNDQLTSILSELGEKQNTLEQNINILKTWLTFQPHLPQSIDENILRSFLRGCKHNVERAKKKIDSYYAGRGAVPELFTDRDPYSKEIQTGSHVLNAFLLPRLTPSGCRVTVHRFNSFDPDKLNVQCIFKYLLMMADVRLIEETAIVGDIYLFDLQDIMLMHCAKLATPLLKKTLVLAQEAYPQRLKEIHVFNAPPFVDWILNVFKALMKEKMRNRFYVHHGHETLHQYVPREILPAEYGGKEKSCRELQDDWSRKLETYQEWFRKEESVKADEEKRPNKDIHQKLNDQMFGSEGAFRRLSID